MHNTQYLNTAFVIWNPYNSIILLGYKKDCLSFALWNVSKTSKFHILRTEAFVKTCNYIDFCPLIHPRQIAIQADKNIFFLILSGKQLTAAEKVLKETIVILKELTYFALQ